MWKPLRWCSELKSCTVYTVLVGNLHILHLGPGKANVSMLGGVSDIACLYTLGACRQLKLWNWQTVSNLLAMQPCDWRLHGEKVGGRRTRYYCAGQGWAEWAITSIHVCVRISVRRFLCSCIYLPIAISPQWWYQFSRQIAFAIEL